MLNFMLAIVVDSYGITVRIFQSVAAHTHLSVSLRTEMYVYIYIHIHTYIHTYTYIYISHGLVAQCAAA